MADELNTLQFFREIAKIPRESGNEEGIANYLVEFAKSRNLFYKKDNFNNVLIKKKTIEKEPLIMQVHTDMVCEKNPKSDFDFKKDAIELMEKDGYLMANGTTLGADNGIGVAQVLAILDSDIPCNIEAVFTVSEETTMIGAMNFDAKDLQGKSLLGLDSFEENTIILESACFYDIVLTPQYDFAMPSFENCYKVSLSGMLGGHSGFDITKNRGNSGIEFAGMLRSLGEMELVDFLGGDKFNVIPSWASAEFYTKKSEQEIAEFCKLSQETLCEKYKGIKIEYSITSGAKRVLNSSDTTEFLDSVINFPHGVFAANENGDATTSVNLGSVNLSDLIFKVGMRSSRKVEEEKLLAKIKEYCLENRLEFKILGYQPGFESDRNSDFIQKLLKSHPTEEFEKPPILKSVHITLETGFFLSKIPNLQVALIAPNIIGAHTTHEKVELDSIRKTDKWLVEFIKNY